MIPIGMNLALAATAAASSTSTTNNPVSFDLTYIVEIVSFLILAWILKKFAWKPLTNMMEKRRQNIADNISHAQKDRKEAEELKIGYQQEMQNARKEAQSIIEKANKTSGERADSILEAARQDAEKKKAAALADIDREREKAIAEAKAQVVDMSIAMANKLLRQEIDDDTQDALFEQFLVETRDRT